MFSLWYLLIFLLKFFSYLVFEFFFFLENFVVYEFGWEVEIIFFLEVRGLFFFES